VGKNKHRTVRYDAPENPVLPPELEEQARALVTETPAEAPALAAPIDKFVGGAFRILRQDERGRLSILTDVWMQIQKGELDGEVQRLLAKTSLEDGNWALLVECYDGSLRRVKVPTSEIESIECDGPIPQLFVFPGKGARARPEEKPRPSAHREPPRNRPSDLERPARKAAQRSIDRRANLPAVREEQPQAPQPGFWTRAKARLSNGFRKLADKIS
jgi:hypothetical protein